MSLIISFHFRPSSPLYKTESASGSFVPVNPKEEESEVVEFLEETNNDTLDEYIDNSKHEAQASDESTLEMSAG